jgi:hypothetical protein
MKDFQKLIVGLLGTLVLLGAFIVGYIVMHPDATPSAREEPPAVVPTTATPAPGAEILKTVSPGTWDPFLNGCRVELEGTRLHIWGTNTQDSWSNNGAKGTAEFPIQDFDVSADFIAPVFNGTGGALVVLRALMDIGDGIGIQYQRGGGYVLMQSSPGAQKLGPLTLRKFGDEETNYHRLRLKYVAATHEATAWVDDQSMGSINHELVGKVRFVMTTRTEKKDNQIDVYFDHFRLTMGGVEANTTLP